ncbi:MAG: hypothetical protein BMS9Abin29_0070 [Gemmatimonadota bacterium]|nr:MAG: hypothetical protein BMS9Abin29_0070 [Gemmatimonadota bacterium]
MIARAKQYGAAALAAAILTTGALEAQGVQQSLGVSVNFQGLSFDDALGIDVANLLLVPIAYRFSVNEKFSADVYAAWAEGRVERGNQTFVLNGAVDTRVRLSFQASPWAVLTVGAALPTGNATHNTEEAVVASVLSSDLLGFNEATWGTGLAITTGMATVHRIGSWGVGLGASYRLADDFAPSADTAFSYSPGNESRIRLALDRNVGETGKFTGGVMFQTFQSDQLDGRNLFQAGDRVRVDASYAFRAGSSTWNLFVANLWRTDGDLSLQLIDDTGTVLGDSILSTGSQNLFMAGIGGAVPVGSTVYIHPMVDVRIQDRNDDGFGAGSGWILRGGLNLPLRLFRAFDLFPRVRGLFGQLKAEGGASEGFWGVETGATIRFR